MKITAIILLAILKLWHEKELLKVYPIMRGRR